MESSSKSPKSRGPKRPSGRILPPCPSVDGRNMSLTPSISFQICLRHKKYAFPEKSPCGLRPQYVNTPSPAALRRQRDARRGRGRRQSRRGGNDIRGIRGGGAPKDKGASLSILSLRSLKSIVSEEICGRLWFMRWIKLLHIGSLGFGRS